MYNGGMLAGSPGGIGGIGGAIAGGCFNWWNGIGQLQYKGDFT